MGLCFVLITSFNGFVQVEDLLERCWTLISIDALYVNTCAHTNLAVAQRVAASSHDGLLFGGIVCRSNVKMRQHNRSRMSNCVESYLAPDAGRVWRREVKG